jgi:cell division protein ZapA (FtsZ GTPase activity inhibitor)
MPVSRNDRQRYDQPASFERRPFGNPLQNGDGGNTFDPMNERISKLEGTQDGLKQSQTILLTSVGIIAAILVTAQIFLFQKVDALSDQMNQLPEKIESRLQGITSALSAAITASKQPSPPQIIILPAQPPLPQAPQKQP